MLRSGHRACQSPHVTISVLTRADKEREPQESQENSLQRHLELMLSAGAHLVLMDLEFLDSG